jgi:hypothetical protein
MHSGFQLGSFQARYQIWSEDELKHLQRLDHKIWRRVSGKLPFLNGAYRVEKSVEFDPQLLHLKDRPFFYFEGYWQHEAYFQKVQQEVRQQLQFRPVPEADTLAWMGRIAQGTSISVHIRRGDYTSTQNQQIYAQIPLEYYLHAAETLAGELGMVRFFVFSDDLNWARQNLIFPGETHYIDGNQGARSYEDLRLMSHCQHHIIANSSFSWWGAWLNPRVDKKVIYPKNWFVKPQWKSLWMGASGWRPL